MSKKERQKLHPFEQFILDTHPDPDSLIVQTNPIIVGKSIIGYEQGQIVDLAEHYKEDAIKSLQAENLRLKEELEEIKTIVFDCPVCYPKAIGENPAN